MTENKNEFNLSAEDRISNRLLENNVHFLTGEITDTTVEKAIKWIVYENSLGHNKNLTLHINSFGGSIYDAFALIDVMRSSKCKVRTIGTGAIMSAAFLIFAAGAKGERYIGRNTSILCHQFSEEVEGKYHDIKALMRENELSNQRMVTLLTECTDLSPKFIKNKLLPATDVWLMPHEIVELGIADHIL